MMKSKKQVEDSEKLNDEDSSKSDGWVAVGQNICYWKTDIQRSGWRVPGPLNMDDEEDED